MTTAAADERLHLVAEELVREVEATTRDDAEVGARLHHGIVFALRSGWRIYRPGEGPHDDDGADAAVAVIVVAVVMLAVGVTLGAVLL